MSAAPVIEARGLGRVLPGPMPVTLVRGIDLAIAPGEFIAITGPSGSGKSSLLYLLGLLDRPSEGSVLLDGRDAAGLPENDRARLRLTRLGFVFQFHFLLPEFTVLGNVLIPMRKLAALSDADMHRRAEELLERLGLGDQARKRPDQLSGGQRQRVAIARALANAPRVILADEPTGNLDTHNARTVFDIFAGLARDTGTAVVTVTHDEHLAAQAGRRIHLVDGRIDREDRA
ncbi:ABC transporter ATP-binding protein [Azospirillum halopraeferens]|uniref:ABC transporter ATP-binding protein n=1 Tax=Azospirillum halopraeferens TaxID=34010 RepID=UPI00041075FA|nr:ABC transporter ATP-binding protein [Azospirillum halopraeferens]